MQGQQFEDDLTQFDPVRANDTSCQDAPLGDPKPDIGVTFTFENCQIADGRFSFDVMIQADEAGRRLGDTEVFLDYNALGFGPNIETNGNLTVMLGTALATNGNYATPIANDVAASKVSIETAFTGTEGDGLLVPTTPMQLLHVEIEIQDGNENSGLNFDQGAMQGAQFEDDGQAFDPVRADDTSCDVFLGGEDDPVGIHFEFDNCRVINGQLKFDVLVSIAEGTRLLGSTETYFNYNADGFGSNVVANGNIMVTLGPALAAHGDYGPVVLSDNAPDRVGVDIDYTGDEADGLEISTTPIVLFSVMMHIDHGDANHNGDDDDDDGDDDDGGSDDDDDDGGSDDDDDDDGGEDERAGISFEQPLMDGRQFESDNTTAFDPVTTGPGCNIPLDGNGDDDDDDGDDDDDDGDPNDPDDDDDGVPDTDDFCSDTRIPEDVPTRGFSTNRWALVDHDYIFDTKPPNGQGPNRSYTTTDTGGCSCEQIIEEQDLGNGHRKRGCSISAMDDWVAHVEIQNSMARIVGAEDPAAALDAVIQELNADLPERFELEPVYPNPFNPEATIRFTVPKAEAVRVALYDVQGRLVQVLYQGTPAAGQVQTLRIEGSGLPSGMYFIRLVSPSHTATQSALLVK